MIRKSSNDRDLVLLTGACGFVGRYLLRDLLAAGRRTAVVARSRGRNSALTRIEKIHAFCQESLGQSLPMPRLVDWDIRETAKDGICPADRVWLLKNVGSVLHSAASVRFTLEAETNEPFESNVIGTLRMIELASELGGVDFHHVSTAYVCGDHTGTIFEETIDFPTFKNVYEESKFLAEEQLMCAADAFKSLTIYRPSIVVGDSSNGYASSFQTIYNGLRLASTLSASQSSDVESLFLWLGLTGLETKNLVPVDWVSEAIVSIFLKTQLHNQIYHLTNPKEVTVQQLAAAMVRAIEKEPYSWRSMKSSSSALFSLDDVKRVFLESFQNYFCRDPEFSRRNTSQALPQYPVPELTLDRLEQMFRFAIRQRFMDSEKTTWTSVPTLDTHCVTEEQIPTPSFAHAWSLTILDDSNPQGSNLEGEETSHFLFDENKSSPRQPDENLLPQILVRRSSLTLLESGALTWEQAMRSAHLVVIAPVDLQAIVLEQFQECISSSFGKMLLGATSQGVAAICPCHKLGER